MIDIANIDLIRREAVALNTRVTMGHGVEITEALNDSLQTLMSDAYKIINTVKGPRILNQNELTLTQALETAEQEKATREQQREEFSEQVAGVADALANFVRELEKALNHESSAAQAAPSEREAII